MQRRAIVMCHWKRMLAALAVFALALSSSARSEEEGAKVPYTRTDQKMETHIWIGNPPKTSSPFAGGTKITSVATNRTIEVQSVLFVAKYVGGDWDANLEVHNGNVWGGSMARLAGFITFNSRSKIKLNVGNSGAPLDLTDSWFLQLKPPFLFLSGTKDFVFADREVANLRAYLAQGGCLWVDNGSPGKDSPFDKAFRREIARVLPGKLQALPDTHPIYTKSWFPLNGPPPGSTGMSEPLEEILMDDTLAVLYLPNGYGALWKLGFDPGSDKEGMSPAFQLGMNVVIHMMTRWDEKRLLQETPKP